MKPFYRYKPSLFYKRAFLLLCFLSASFTNLNAQAWFQKLYARNKNDSVSGINAVKQLADGNYILAGGFGPCPAINNCIGDGLIIKTDNSGEVAWTRVMGGIRSDGFLKAIQTADGNYVFAGETQSFGVQATANVYGEYMYVVKTNPNGDTLFTRIYGGTNTDYSHNNEIQDMQATLDGGFIITAYINYQNAFPYAYSPILVKCNAQGDTLWTKRYNTPNNLGITHITQIADSGYVFTGGILDSMGSAHGNGFVTQIDKKGNVLWTKMYGGAYDDYFNDIIKCGNGYLAVGGSLSFSSNHNITYMYAVRLDSLGDTLWTKVYGPSNCNYSLHINDSTAYMMGLSASSLGIYAVLKINTNTGTCIMKNYYGQADLIGACDITQDGGFIIPGNTGSFGSQHGEACLLKADSIGNAGCNQHVATMTITSTQTSVSSISMQTYHYPMYVNSTQTQMTYGNLLDSTLCSSSVGIKQFTASSNQLRIFPNPAHNSLIVTLSGNNDLKTIQIRNVLGAEIKREELKIQNGQVKIDVDNLPSGIYFITASTNNGVYTTKFIKE